jgi:hypothetical protein
MRQRPDLEIVYAHNYYPHLLVDAGKFISTKEIPSNLLAGVGNEKMYVDKENNCVYINVHIFPWKRNPIEPNGNWAMITDNWLQIHNELSNLGIDFKFNDQPEAYIPATDYSFCKNLEAADNFLKETDGKIRLLFCNGYNRAHQSDVGNLSEPITRLSHEFPQCVFICTEEFSTNSENVKFTKNIFQLDVDVNEIAYLSKYCSVIGGKNSGPYMHTHTKDNFFRTDVTFVAFGNRASDSYPCHIKWDNGCRYIHTYSTNTEQIVNILRNIIVNPIENPGYMEIL